MDRMEIQWSANGVPMGVSTPPRCALHSILIQPWQQFGGVFVFLAHCCFVVHCFFVAMPGVLGPHRHLGHQGTTRTSESQSISSFWASRQGKVQREVRTVLWYLGVCPRTCTALAQTRLASAPASAPAGAPAARAPPRSPSCPSALLHTPSAKADKRLPQPQLQSLPSFFPFPS